MRTTGTDLLTLAAGYADRFPDGDTAERIMLRLTEELGEVAAEVALPEGH